MRVNIVTGDGIKYKYTVENLDSAMDIIKDYAEENNLNYEVSNELYKPVHDYKPNLVNIVHFFKPTSSVKHYEGSAFIWSK